MKIPSTPKFSKRPLSALGILLTILFINFLLIQATDTHRLRQENLGSRQTSPEEIEERIAVFRREFDLDKPIVTRFFSWMKKVAILDFGHGMIDPRPVRTIVGEALSQSIWLQIPSILLFFLIGIPLGVFMAANAGGFFDRILGSLLLGAYAMPTFWVATLLLIYGATSSGYDIFPLEGLSSPKMEGACTWVWLKDRGAHMVLPVFALSLPGVTVIARQTRSAMLETLSSDFILAARASGISERRVIWVHALRNSLLPAATLLGLLLPQLVGGSVVVESIFNVKGIGLLLWQSANARDFPVLQALILLSTILTLVGFVVADFMATRLNPKVSRA